MSIDVAINLDYLLPELRLMLGDTNAASYRYTDGWLRVSLVSAVKALGRWWDNRYTIDSNNNAVRSADLTFLDAEPEVLESEDEMIVLLMAKLLVQEGSLEASSWNLGSWRDAEYAVSNIASGGIKDAAVKRTWEKLLLYIKPPTKRLSPGTRVSFDDFGADETK